MATDAPPREGEVVTLLTGASRHITITSGSMVLIRSGDRECFGAIVRKIKGNYAQLTFTPRTAPREVPLGLILSSVGDEPATLDLSSIPRYQPEPTVTPRRRRVRG